MKARVLAVGATAASYEPRGQFEARLQEMGKKRVSYFYDGKFHAEVTDNSDLYITAWPPPGQSNVYQYLLQTVVHNSSRGSLKPYWH